MVGGLPCSDPVPVSAMYTQYDEQGTAQKFNIVPLYTCRLSKG